MTAQTITAEEMERHVFRFKAENGNSEAFASGAVPDFQKSIYKIINKGTVPNPKVMPAIATPHPFSMSIVKLAPGKGGGLHAHDTEEVFLPLDGSVVFFWGDGGAEEQLVLGQWDVISFPPGIMHRFRNDGARDLHLVNMVAGYDHQVGSITYHPDVEARIAAAKALATAES
jgi:mannose-6-phosphate isomerase-like protein (cupin superfamily)